MTPAAILERRAKNAPDPNIRSWGDLFEVPTVGEVLPLVKAWVDLEAGVTRFTSLLESTAATDTAAGVLRPRDYDPAKPRAWFQAA